MKVLNICSDDWANFSFDNLMALRSVGIECNGMKLMPHPFKYDKEMPIGDLGDMVRLIESHDIIQFFHDNASLFLALKPYFEGKRVIPYHTTSNYRLNYSSINTVMNPFAHRCVNAMPEFMGKGAANEIYLTGCVGDLFKTIKTSGNRFTHLPSNPSIKGTDRIAQLFEQTGIWLLYHTSARTHEQQLYLMLDCMVYIEMLQLTDGNGMPYGNFGMTALEAASMGKVVVTNCKDLDIYSQTYGKPSLRICNSEPEFVECIKNLNEMPVAELHREMADTRSWFIKTHSYEATGKFITERVLS